LNAISSSIGFSIALYTYCIIVSICKAIDCLPRYDMPEGAGQVDASRAYDW
jgi:hypothetical protein